MPFKWQQYTVVAIAKIRNKYYIWKVSYNPDCPKILCAMVFLLLMISFLLLKDTTYDLETKWIIFAILAGIFLWNIFLAYKRKTARNGKSSYAWQDKITVFGTIAVTLTLAFVQYKKTLP